MKMIVALLAMIASTQASGFWGWNDYGNTGYGNAYNNGYADGAGAADAEADFAFDFNMTARIRTEGSGKGYGSGYGYGNGHGYGYNNRIPYYGAPYGYLPPPAPVAPGPPQE